MTSARDLNLAFNRLGKEISSVGAKAKLEGELKPTSYEQAEGSLEILLPLEVLQCFHL